jgi:hypothetical protein
MRKPLLLSLIALATVLFPVSVSAGFAPARTTFQCVTNTDCPGPAYVTFNSFIDAPNPDAPNGGDEQSFFEGKDAGSTSTLTGFGDSFSVQDGERLLLRVYIHNDANPTILGVAGARAHNTKVLVNLPATASSTNTATAFISADNANPVTISDTLTMSGSTPFNLTLDTNSPVSLTSRIGGEGDFVTRSLGSTAFTSSNSLSINLGDWDGGFKNHGSLTFVAVVHMSGTTVQPIAATTSFACTALDVNTIDSTRSTFTATSNPTVSGARVSSYVFTVKDSNGNVVDTSTVNTASSTAVYNFDQSTPGTYTITTVVNSDKGSSNPAVCTRQITVAAQPVTLAASTTTTPTESGKTTLPNTGGGGVLAIFSGASALGGLGHYLVNRRRNW